MKKFLVLFFAVVILISAQIADTKTIKLDMVTNFSRASYLGKIGMRYVEYVKIATQGEVELVFHEDGDIVPVSLNSHRNRSC